jgi:Uma2 family endonuclease
MDSELRGKPIVKERTGLAPAAAIQEYLHSDYQPDREYVDGEIQERNLGEKDHSRIQMAVAAFFHALRGQGLYTFPELRVQVSPTRFRVPDVTVTIGDPDEQILTKPPYIVVEILSPEDTVRRLLERVCDYEEFGVENIWVIDPGLRRGYVASGGALLPVDVLRTAGREGRPEVSLVLAKLFEEA